MLIKPHIFLLWVGGHMAHHIVIWNVMALIVMKITFNGGARKKKTFGAIKRDVVSL